MNRAPTSLMAGICFHSCRPLVRNRATMGSELVAVPDFLLLDDFRHGLLGPK